MTRDHLLTALDALDSVRCDLENRIAREPKTRGGKPNAVRDFLQRELAKTQEANDAIAAHLGVSADFHDRNPPEGV